MGQLRTRIKTGSPENVFEKVLESELLSAWKELSNLINRGLGFADNFNCTVIDVADTGAANTEFVVAHTLRRIPTGYLVVKRDKAGVVYESGTTWTIASIYLKCSTANTKISVIIF